MSEFLFCTLSVGLPYTRDYTIQLIDEVLSLTTSRIAITTDHPDFLRDRYPGEERLLIDTFDRSKYKIRLGSAPPVPTQDPSCWATDFNFNLKYTVLEPLIGIQEKYIIFMDCDDKIGTWDEEKTLEWVTAAYERGANFYGERTNPNVLPDIISEYIRTLYMKEPMSLGWHKVWAYDLIHNLRPEWKCAGFPTEHLFILVNEGDKLKKFYDQWKELHDHLASLPYTHGTWAEGIELGICAAAAGYTPCDIPYEIMRQFVVSGHKDGFHHATER